MKIVCFCVFFVSLWNVFLKSPKNVDKKEKVNVDYFIETMQSNAKFSATKVHSIELHMWHSVLNDFRLGPVHNGKSHTKTNASWAHSLLQRTLMHEWKTIPTTPTTPTICSLTGIHTHTHPNVHIERVLPISDNKRTTTEIKWAHNRIVPVLTCARAKQPILLWKYCFFCCFRWYARHSRNVLLLSSALCVPISRALCSVEKRFSVQVDGFVVRRLIILYYFFEIFFVELFGLCALRLSLVCV